MRNRTQWLGAGDAGDVGMRPQRLENY